MKAVAIEGIAEPLPTLNIIPGSPPMTTIVSFLVTPHYTVARRVTEHYPQLDELLRQLRPL